MTDDVCSDDWPFPWHKPIGVYDSDGPGENTIVHLVGADYSVEPTGDCGLDSGRDKFRVECLTCSELLHHNTTGPSSRILYHQSERHTK